MIDHMDIVTPYQSGILVDATNVAASTTRYQGKFSVGFDTTAADGRVMRWLIPTDLGAFCYRSLRLSVTSNARLLGAANALVRLVYAVDPADPSIITTFDEYDLTGAVPVAGGAFERAEHLLDEPTGGNATPTDRRKLIALQLVAAGGGPLVGVLFDAVELWIEGRPCDVAAIDIGVDRVVMPAFTGWLRNPERRTVQNAGEGALETVHLSTSEEVFAEVRNVRQNVLREALRKFSAFAQSKNGWSIARNANARGNSLLISDSGVGQPDPRVLFLDDVIEFDRLGPGHRVRVGPNLGREVEVATILEVRPGTNEIVLEEALRYPHETGSPVTSVDYYPNVGLRKSGDPVRVSGNRWGVRAECREAV